MKRKIKFIKHEIKSQSEVISTVLMILIVVVAIFIIMAFVFPFIKEQLSGSECIKVIGEDKLGIVNNPSYTCNNLITNELRVQIFVGDILDKISSFKIETGGASTKTFDVDGSEATTDFCLYKGKDDTCSTDKVDIPGKNEQRTYTIKLSNDISNPDFIKAYPVLKNGKVCGVSSTITTIPVCE